MTAIIIPNSLQGQKSPDIPYKEDGKFYEYMMYFDGDSKIAYSDDPADLIEILIPKYSEGTAEERLDNRIRYVLNMQKVIQGIVLADLSADRRAALEEWQLKALDGSYNKTESYAVRDFWKETLPEGVKPEDVDADDQQDVWTLDEPLVLVDMAYQPWTDRYPPIGKPDGSNILWLKPSDEVEFLDSLSETGQIKFGIERS